ncbi:MAG: RNA polymerase sigma factor RpoD/SigA [Nanoarchaeota archaeon]|nr:RNA polymerase sigma factor RpoD/SigA [Nanoarchaeota archaeon]
MKRDRNLDIYLAEISKYPILGEEEERSLAISIQNNYYRYIKERDRVFNNSSSLPEIEKSIEEGQKAREKFIKSKLRDVVVIARQFKNQRLSLADLIQEGNIGLIKAVENYDPYRQVRFATYATYWINQSIKGAIKNSTYTIRIPVNNYNYFKEFRNSISTKIEKDNEQPTNEEIARDLQIHELTVKKIKQAELVLKKNKEMVSLNYLPENRKNSLEAQINDEDSDSELNPLETKELYEIIEKTINKFRDKEILKRRFGLNGYNPTTLENIGKIFNLTRERIRQIESNLLKKLNFALSR